MGMPNTLKNFNLFNDANSYMGQAPELKLPKLTRKVEELRAGGMNGPVSIDLGQEKLELEFTLAGMDKLLFSQYASSKIDGVALRFAGAYQRDDTGEVMAVEVSMRGRHSEIDPGDSKAGDMSKIAVKTQLTYYKLTINNEEVIEIDLLNMIEKINGVDVLKDQRQAVGLG